MNLGRFECYRLLMNAQVLRRISLLEFATVGFIFQQYFDFLACCCCNMEVGSLIPLFVDEFNFCG